MKKSLLLLAAVTLVLPAISQVPYKNLDGKEKQKVVLNSSAQDIRDQYQKQFKSGLRENEYWVSYPLDYDSLIGFTAELWGNYLFPDSNVYVDFSDGAGGTVEGTPFIHEIGQIMNPLSDVFEIIDGVIWDETTPYYVDSAGIVMAYFRNTDASVVDTLMVYMYTGATTGSGNLPLYYYTDGPGFSFSNTYGYDTIYVPFMKYSYTSNKPSATGLKTFKVPLYEEDSSSFYYFKLFSTENLSVPAGQKVAMAVTFKPGYSYNPFDNVSTNANYVIFGSYEENGAETFPAYYPEDYNISSIIPTAVRYNQSPTGYNGLFIPTYAYIDEAYAFEQHLFLYNISDELVGVEETPETVNSLFLHPNPASDYATLSFNMNDNAGVSIKLYDLAGKEMAGGYVGYLSKGLQRQALGLDGLSNGMYLVQIESEGSIRNMKLMVSR